MAFACSACLAVNLSTHADDACSTCGRAILASGSSVLDAALPRQAEQLAFEIQSGCGRTSSNEICLRAFDVNSAEYPLLQTAWEQCQSVIDVRMWGEGVMGVGQGRYRVHS